MNKVLLKRREKGCLVLTLRHKVIYRKYTKILSLLTEIIWQKKVTLIRWSKDNLSKEAKHSPTQNAIKDRDNLVLSKISEKYLSKEY